MLLPGSSDGPADRDSFVAAKDGRGLVTADPHLTSRARKPDEAHAGVLIRYPSQLQIASEKRHLLLPVGEGQMSLGLLRITQPHHGEGNVRTGQFPNRLLSRLPGVRVTAFHLMVLARRREEPGGST